MIQRLTAVEKKFEQLLLLYIDKTTIVWYNIQVPKSRCGAIGEKNRPLPVAEKGRFFEWQQLGEIKQIYLRRLNLSCNGKRARF